MIDIEKIKEGMLQIISEYGLRVLFSEGKVLPVDWRDKLLQFLANEGMGFMDEEHFPNPDGGHDSFLRKFKSLKDLC